MPYKCVASHLKAVLVTDLHGFIYCVEIDLRHILFCVVRRNIIAKSFCFGYCDKSCLSAPQQIIRFHLISKSNNVGILFDRIYDI